MTKQTGLRILTYGGGVVLIIFVLFLSITRQALYAPTLEEQLARSKVPISTRLTELQTWPPTPDHPFYPLRMVWDQVDLRLTSGPARVEKKFAFAKERMQSASILLSRGRYSLALTTLTKAGKYTIAAALDADAIYANQSTQFRESVKAQVASQQLELERLKPFFNDGQRAEIDRLIAELSILSSRFP